MTSSSGGIGGVPAMPYLSSSTSLKKINDAEQQLLDAYNRIQSLSDKPNVQAALQNSLNLIIKNFSTILTIKYSEDAQTIINNMSPDQLNQINEEIDAMEQQISNLQSQIDEYTRNISTLNTEINNLIIQDQSIADKIGQDTNQINQDQSQINDLNSQIYNLTHSQSYLDAVANLPAAQQAVDVDQAKIASFSGTNAHLDSSYTSFAFLPPEVSQYVRPAVAAINDLSFPTLTLLTRDVDNSNAPLSVKVAFRAAASSLSNKCGLFFSGNQAALTVSDMLSFQTSLQAVQSYVSTFNYNIGMNDITATIAGMQADSQYIIATFLQPKLVADQETLNGYQITINDVNTQVAVLQAQQASLRDEIDRLTIEISGLTVQKQDIEAQIALDQANLQRLEDAQAAAQAQLTVDQNNLALLLQQQQAAQSVYDQGVSFFDKLTPLEKTLLRALYPNAVFPS